MRASEWVETAYFAYLFVVALITLHGPRRRAAAIRSAVALVAVLLPVILPSFALPSIVRDWLPALYLVIGYWLSGLYFVAPMPAIEQRFLAGDRWCYRAGLSAFVALAPRLLLEVLELAYLICFVFVPGGMLILFLAGASASADHFWTVVLASEFGSFGMLPWIQTRPPRDIEPPDAINRRKLTFRQVNQFMVQRTSIGVNTFPSGHVAGALATALVVSETLPAFRLPMMTGAGLIAVSTVIGRYHYAVDVIAGVALVAVIWTIVHLM